MRKEEALNILEIVQLNAGQPMNYTAEDVKLQYRRMCSKYHPDRNPMGEHMMKLVNEAYELLRDSDGVVEDEPTGFCEGILNAIRPIAELGLTIELCGTWVWVSGDTKPHKELLKSLGYRWSSKKIMWYYHSGEKKSYGRGRYTIDEIRERHGSRGVQVKGWDRVARA